MWQSAAEWVDGHPLLAILLLTVAFEGVTACGRFALGLEATRDTAALASMTGGWRIHHCYVGVLLLALALAVPPPARACVLCVGAALVASDLLHHFAVLWPVTGAHEFDVTYPTSR